MTAIVLWILVVIVAGILLTDKGRTLAKGFLNLFFEDVVKTPKGAEAAYAQAIEEEQERYNKASDILNNMSGKLTKAKEKLEYSTTELQKVEKNCERFVAAGDMNNAAIQAERREELLLDIDIYKKEIIKLEPMVKEATFIFQNTEKELKRLKKERNTVIKQMELNQQSEEVYNNLDELKNMRGSKKLINTIKDEVEAGEERVAGARTVYSNKASTKIKQSEEALRKVQTNDYLEQLKKKYNK